MPIVDSIARDELGIEPPPQRLCVQQGGQEDSRPAIRWARPRLVKELHGGTRKPASAQGSCAQYTFQGPGVHNLELQVDVHGLVQ